MDKAKILRLCNEINDKIVEFWNCEQIEHDDVQHIISLLDLIGFDISAPPKTNADRIRQMTEVRPIDANALKAKLKIDANTATYSDYCNGYCDARQVDLDAIDAAPTIEPEVRHGRWIIKPHGSYRQLRAFCSACGKHSGIGGIESNQRKPFCPNCGADMREEGADNG